MAALAETVGFSVFEEEEEVFVDGLQRCQGLEAADGLFQRFRSECGNRMEHVIRRYWWRAARQCGEHKEETARVTISCRVDITRESRDGSEG